MDFGASVGALMRAVADPEVAGAARTRGRVFLCQYGSADPDLRRVVGVCLEVHEACWEALEQHFVHDAPARWVEMPVPWAGLALVGLDSADGSETRQVLLTNVPASYSSSALVLRLDKCGWEVLDFEHATDPSTGLECATSVVLTVPASFDLPPEIILVPEGQPVFTVGVHPLSSLPPPRPSGVVPSWVAAACRPARRPAAARAAAPCVCVTITVLSRATMGPGHGAVEACHADLQEKVVHPLRPQRASRAPCLTAQTPVQC